MSPTYRQPTVGFHSLGSLPTRTQPYTIGEFVDYGTPRLISLKDGQRAIITSDALSGYSDEEIQQIISNLQRAIACIEKAVPEYHEVFVDDIKRIGVIAPDDMKHAYRKIRHKREEFSLGVKSDDDPDLLFLNADLLLSGSPEQIAGVLGHEELHALLTHLKNTKEEEALAFKTEDVILTKLHQRGLSDKSIREIINRYYKRIPSILGV
jgi:hypothetical protein